MALCPHLYLFLSLFQLLSIFHPCLSSYFAPNTSLRVLHCLSLSLLISPCFTPPSTFGQILLVSFCLSFLLSWYFLSVFPCLRQPSLFTGHVLHSCFSPSFSVPHRLSLSLSLHFPSFFNRRIPPSCPSHHYYSFLSSFSFLLLSFSLYLIVSLFHSFMYACTPFSFSPQNSCISPRLCPILGSNPLTNTRSLHRSPSAPIGVYSRSLTANQRAAFP